MMANGIKVRGQVKVVARYVDTGVEEVIFDGPNLVVNNGLEILANLLAYAGDDRAMATIHFGSGSTALDLTDAGLTTYVGQSPITSVAVTAPEMVEFGALIDETQGNLETIREIGLFNGEAVPVMFARDLIGAVEKQANMTLTISWRITFTQEV